MSRRWFVIGLCAVGLLFMALRLPLLRCGAFGADVRNFNDEANYTIQAESLRNGDTYADTILAWMRAPLPALTLNGLGWLRELPPELLVCEFQWLQLLLWLAVGAALTAIAARLFDRRTALLTALLLALLPETIWLVPLVGSDTLFIAGLVGAVAALFAGHYRPHPVWPVVAGLLAGLGALARPMMLPLLPVLLLWAALLPRRMPVAQNSAASFWQQVQQVRLLPPLLLLVCCFAVIAPWTFRNYQLYGGLILLDTTGGVNLWINNTDEPRGRVTARVMAHSPNPVERQRFASAQGLAVIAENPQRFAAKVLSESYGAWFVRSFRVTFGVWHELLQQPRTAALLAQLNLLQALTLGLLPFGLLFAPRKAPGARVYLGAMLLMATAYMLVVAVQQFSVRYRTPFIVLLLPYIAWCLAHPGQLLAAFRRPLAWAALALVLLMTFASFHLLWPAQWRNAQALALHGRGLLYAAAGDHQHALADQRGAVEHMPLLREARIALAHAQAASGAPAAAEATLRAVLADMPARFKDAPDAVTALQYLLLEQGRTAEVAELDRFLSTPARRVAERQTWQAGLPPDSQIDLGDDDFGLLNGFYPAESVAGDRFRWSRPAARVWLAGAGDQVCLRLNANRAAEAPPPVVRLALRTGGPPQQLGTLRPPRRGWAWFCRPLPADHGVEPFVLEITTPRYNPFRYSDSVDTRNLGVAVAAVELRDGKLPLDPPSGLLLDYPAAGATSDGLQLLGAELRAAPVVGDALPLRLWWRGLPPPAGTFVFVHVLDAEDNQVAAYNAPFSFEDAAAPFELQATPAALELPTDNQRKTYRLVAGLFDPASGAVLVRAELGALALR